MTQGLPAQPTGHGPHAAAIRLLRMLRAIRPCNGSLLAMQASAACIGLQLEAARPHAAAMLQACPALRADMCT